MTVSQHLLEHLTAFSIGNFPLTFWFVPSFKPVFLTCNKCPGDPFVWIRNGLPRTLVGIELKVNNCHSPYCGTGL